MPVFDLLQNFLPKRMDRKLDRVRLTVLETSLHLFWPRRMRFRTDRILLEGYKAIYFAIPKVACTSLKFMCADLLGYQVTGNVHFYKFPKVFELERRHRSDYFKFCFVRNPFDRALSCYLHKFREHNYPAAFVKNGVYGPFARYGVFHAGMSFDEFVRGVAAVGDEDADVHFRSQHTFVAEGRKNLLVDYVGRLEGLQKDVAYLSERLGFPPVRLHHFEKTHHSGYRRYYTAESRSLVERRYKTDLELFDYAF